VGAAGKGAEGAMGPPASKTPAAFKTPAASKAVSAQQPASQEVRALCCWTGCRIAVLCVAAHCDAICGACAERQGSLAALRSTGSVFCTSADTCALLNLHIPLAAHAQSQDTVC
jgi:hypothetical protein